MNAPRSARALMAWATGALEHAGVPAAALEAGWLLEHVTGMPRLRRVALGEDSVPEVAAAMLAALVERRVAREPLQHILGKAAFLDLELSVDARVLVPRPETEQLVLMASACISENSAPRILDLGTGSGCIALALALRHPRAEILAVDVSADALEVATANGRRLGLAGRVHWVHADAFGVESWSGPGLAGGRWGRFDLVVSNPPYIPSGEIETLEPEVRDHDPRLALDGGGDGLVPYRVLAQSGWKALVEGGWMALEFGDGQGPALERCFSRDEWEPTRLGKDLSGRDRVLIVRRSRR